MIDLECNMFSSTTPDVNHYTFDKSVKLRHQKINLSKKGVLAQHAFFFTKIDINLNEFTVAIPSHSSIYYNEDG